MRRENPDNAQSGLMIQPPALRPFKDDVTPWTESVGAGLSAIGTHPLDYRRSVLPQRRDIDSR